MHKKFDSTEIEKKWQAIWKESGIYTVGERDLSKPKSYVLVEWPYPSGNLHIGHWYAFAVPDIYARFKRMTGHQVLYPMGFDAFGLPAENAAIKRNLNPKDWTYENMAFMREQLERMGNMFSWDKTTNSTDQDYYKWTQWMFTQFFEKGIAYRGKGIVNWCPGCNTAVANEQVLADGTCERSGDIIEKREMPQWMMKITDYADRLIDDLDTLDWPTHIKEAQKQWIGRSKGAKINFTINPPRTSDVLGGEKDVVTVFTTRPDTLFGATYLVLAPEHSLIQNRKEDIENWKEVSDYITISKQKNEQDRLDATKEKTGVILDGISATNPANGEQIPVYVADYVLGGYGTGAIMAVPAHDERDYAFATKFGLPIKHVVQPLFTATSGESAVKTDAGEYVFRNAVVAVVRNPKDDTYLCVSWKTAVMNGLVTGGIEEGEDMIEAARREVAEETGYINVTTIPHDEVIIHSRFYHRIKKQNRWAKFHYVFFDLLDDVKIDVDENEAAVHEVSWKTLKELESFFTVIEGEFIVNILKEKNEIYTGNGILTNSSEALRIFDEKKVVQHFRTGVYGLIRNSEGKYLVQFFPKQKYYWFPGGGVEAGENEMQTLTREIIEETGYKNFTIGNKICSPVLDYIRRDDNVPARNYCHVYEVFLNSEEKQLLNLTTDELKDGMELNWLTLEEIMSDTDVLEIERSNLISFCVTQSISKNYKFDGMDSAEAKEKIVAKVGGEMTSTYRLRDWSIGRQRYWGVPIPIVYDPSGVAHIVPKEHLPWVLPEDVDFKPTGVAPLSKSEALKKRTEEIFGTGWTPEVETMDTFVDSSWYFLRYFDNQNTDSLSSLEKQNEWMPIDMYFGGAEHTTMHLLYSRFWQKALFDLGLVTESEPYKQRVNHGMILGPDGNKMSKSKGNVVDPDAQVALVGADTVKIYLAFMGPYADSSYPWDFGGIAGVRRFLERSYGLIDHIGESEPIELTRQLHKTITKVGTDIQEFKYNTAISAMMILVNLAEKGSITKESYELFNCLLAPFAPHLAEEIWTQLGHTTSVHIEDFPVADAALSVDTLVVIGVQINGKLRGDITIAPDATEIEALNAVQSNPTLQEKLLSGTLKKVIYVPGRILNLLLD